jgi:hypothetical protein
LSVYFGLSAGSQPLDVSFFDLLLHRNVFANCTVSVSSDSFETGGNAYGGAVSIYMGGYSSLVYFAAATVGNTTIRNASVSVDTAAFTSCTSSVNANIGSAYGGSFSFFVGGYALSYSESTSGSTTVIGLSVFVSNTSSLDCNATTTGDLQAGVGSNSAFGGSNQGNAYGGSMNVVYIGAYALSFTGGSSGGSVLPQSSATCDTTNVTGLVVSIQKSTFVSSSAISRAFSSPSSILFF